MRGGLVEELKEFAEERKRKLETRCKVCSELLPVAVKALNESYGNVALPAMAEWIRQKYGKSISRWALKGHFGRRCGGRDAAEADRDRRAS